MWKYNASVFIVAGGHTGVAFGADSVEKLMNDARDYVSLFFANDAARKCARVEISENCAHCEAQGWIQRTPRSKRVVCKRCTLGEAKRLVDVYVERENVDPANTVVGL